MIAASRVFAWVGSAWGVFVSLGFVSTNAADPVRPNIVYILADDMGYGDLGCYGQKRLATPLIDRMAAEGIRFTRHYAGCTVCAPSRCVLMTGRDTRHGAVKGNAGGPLPDSEVTVAEVLRDAGYVTGCYGKWGVGNPERRDDANRQGFDEFFGYNNMHHAHNFYPEFLIKNGAKVPLRNVLKPRWKEAGANAGISREGAGVSEVKVDYAPDLIVDAALAFMETKASGNAPFFLYLAFNVPHANNEGGADPEQQNGMEVPDHGVFKSENWPEPEKGFASMMRNIDRDVGRVLDSLRRLGLDEKTMVLFSSDNGPHAEGRHSEEFFDSNGELRGKKRDLYDGGVRVPFIVRWPGHIVPGQVSDLLSGFQDFLPTAAQLAGILPSTLPPGQGLSLVPTLLREEGQQLHDHLYWEFEEQGGKRAVVTKEWKAVRLQTKKQPDGPVELYHLDEDLGEMRNVAAEHPEVVSRLTRLLDE